jgi:hypothetical protein
MRLVLLMIAVLTAGALAACGEDTERRPAVEAREGNEALVGDFSYRVILFRELNPETAGDQSLVESVRTDADHGLYAAFVEVCNRGQEPRAPAARIVLEDAFGERWKPLRDGVEPSLAYRPHKVAPGECIPATGSVAARTFDGAAVVFEVPYSVTQERPLILDIRQTEESGEGARIVLDL